MAVIGFISLGCAKNQVDCERMMFRVKEAGHTVSSELPGCDVVVINTCGFIDSAKSEAIDNILMVGAMKAEGKIGKILVTGCLSQRYQGEITKEMPEVCWARAATQRLSPPLKSCWKTGRFAISAASIPRRWSPGAFSPPPSTMLTSRLPKDATTSAPIA